MNDKLIPTTAIDKPDAEKLLRDWALEIGRKVSFHIETMYPEAVKAASSTFLLSVRNSTFNAIVGSAESQETIAAQIFRGSEHRRQIRNMKFAGERAAKRRGK